jgi:hypothetical protein
MGKMLGEVKEAHSVVESGPGLALRKECLMHPKSAKSLDLKMEWHCSKLRVSWTPPEKATMWVVLLYPVILLC